MCTYYYFKPFSLVQITGGHGGGGGGGGGDDDDGHLTEQQFSLLRQNGGTGGGGGGDMVVDITQRSIFICYMLFLFDIQSKGDNRSWMDDDKGHSL
ncbi:hypothetical protein M0804_002963 [Polistes exclamans]|nr:hypothetical protein M0804_002963 [Polistes exclamans]